MIALDMAVMQGEFSAVLAAAHPLEGLRALIHAKVSSSKIQNDGQLWAEIAAMSRRNVSVGHAACAMEDNVASNLTDIFAIETGLSPAEAKHQFAAEAAFIMVLVRSVAMISPREDTSINDLKSLILRSIDQTLDSIADRAAKHGAVSLKGL